MKHSQQSRQLSAGSRVNKMEVIQRSAQAQAGVVAELAYQRDKKQSLADRLRAFRSAPSPILRCGFRFQRFLERNVCSLLNERGDGLGDVRVVDHASLVIRC